MEPHPQEMMTPEEKSRVWWRGAISGALKGIPQGLMLGLLGYALLVGTVYAIAALFPPIGIGLAASFGPFLFGATAVEALAGGTLLPFSFGILNPLPVIALNAVLTVAGNFITGGKIAIGDYQQKIDHTANVERIRNLEGREYMLEQVVGEHIRGSKNVQSILARGARNVESFVTAEETRAAEVAKSKILQ